MFNSPSTQKPLNVFYACHKDLRYRYPFTVNLSGRKIVCLLCLLVPFLASWGALWRPRNMFQNCDYMYLGAQGTPGRPKRHKKGTKGTKDKLFLLPDEVKSVGRKCKIPFSCKVESESIARKCEIPFPIKCQ